jgi:hypothetical protein
MRVNKMLMDARPMWWARGDSLLAFIAVELLSLRYLRLAAFGIHDSGRRSPSFASL